MNVPDNLKYTRSDEWIKLEGDIATIGITDYAQHELGEVVYVELPEVGSKVKKEVSFGVVESVKAVSELLSPVDGEVLEANTPLTDAPATINDSPYEDGWMIKVRVADPASIEALDSAAYAAYRSASGH